MENNATVALAAIGLVGTIMVFVVKPLFSLLKANTKAQDRQTDAMKIIADETKLSRKAHEKSAAEAERRNGHIAELIIESRDKVVETVQHVDEQKVEHQTIKETHKG